MVVPFMVNDTIKSSQTLPNFQSGSIGAEIAFFLSLSCHFRLYWKYVCMHKGTKKTTCVAAGKQNQ